jgi:hypothetical protein
MRLISRSSVLLALLSLATAAAADELLESAEARSPAEAYASLVMVQVLAEGADRRFVERLIRSDSDERDLAVLLDGTANPVARIADPESLLHGAAQIVDFGLSDAQRIRDTIERLEREHPEVIADVDRIALYEEAILLRLSIIESLESRGAGELSPIVERYTLGTTRIRNDMETERFAVEMKAMTLAASRNLKGAHEALGRVLGSDADLEEIDDAVAQAERMSEASREQNAMESANRLYNVYRQMMNTGYSVSIPGP